jgi:hypothetical protein
MEAEPHVLRICIARMTEIWTRPAEEDDLAHVTPVAEAPENKGTTFYIDGGNDGRLGGVNSVVFPIIIQREFSQISQIPWPILASNDRPPQGFDHGKSGRNSAKFAPKNQHLTLASSRFSFSVVLNRQSKDASRG